MMGRYRFTDFGRGLAVGIVLQLVVATLFVALLGCAYLRVERECRAECSKLRGPVMTYSGEPTVPPPAFEDCERACVERREQAEGGK